MKLDKSVIYKLRKWAALYELDFQLPKLDLVIKKDDSSQSILVENTGSTLSCNCGSDLKK